MSKIITFYSNYGSILCRFRDILSLSLSILTAIFQVNLGCPVFIEATAGFESDGNARERHSRSFLKCMKVVYRDRRLHVRVSIV